MAQEAAELHSSLLYKNILIGPASRSHKGRVRSEYLSTIRATLSVESVVKEQGWRLYRLS